METNETTNDKDNTQAAEGDSVQRLVMQKKLKGFRLSSKVKLYYDGKGGRETTGEVIKIEDTRILVEFMTWDVEPKKLKNWFAWDVEDECICAWTEDFWYSLFLA